MSNLGTTSFSQHAHEFNGHYRGQVLDNADPLKKGRIKIRVFPMFEEITTEHLPWAIPAGCLFSGAGSGFGSFAVPEVLSWVWVFFEQGSVYQPVYFAEAGSAVDGVPVESQTNYPNRRVIKTKIGITLYTDDTTKTVVIKTPSGIQATLDDTAHTLTLTQPAGATIQLDATGQVLINGTNIVVTTGGITTWTGTGNINVNSSGSVNVTAAGVVTLQGSTINLNKL